MVAHVSQWLQSLPNWCEVKATAGLVLLRLPQLVTSSLRELLLLVETCVQELLSNMMEKNLVRKCDKFMQPWASWSQNKKLVFEDGI